MPSHARVSTVEAPAHIEQYTLVLATAHAPAPLQYPSLPHTLPESIGHSSMDSTVGATGAHRPFPAPVSASLQPMHTPPHAALQQNPSTQWPLPHSVPVEHVVPLPPPVDALDDAAVVAAAVVAAVVAEVALEAVVVVEVALALEVVAEVALEVDIAVAVDVALEVDAAPGPIAPELIAPVDVDAAPPAFPSSNASKS